MGRSLRSFLAGLGCIFFPLAAIMIVGTLASLLSFDDLWLRIALLLTLVLTVVPYVVYLAMNIEWSSSSDAERTPAAPWPPRQPS